MHVNGKQPHILCVDPNPEILELLRTLLEDAGYRVSTLTTLEHDLDKVAALAPDLMTIDFMWTTSDNEWTFLNWLMTDQRTRNVPVILCTAAVSETQQMQQMLGWIGVRVIFKPFDIETFLGAVEERLEQKQSLDQDSRSDV